MLAIRSNIRRFPEWKQEWIRVPGPTREIPTGGNDRSDVGPSKSHDRHRAAPPHLVRSSSTTGRTGTD